MRSFAMAIFALGLLTLGFASPASAVALPEFTTETGFSGTFQESQLTTSGAEITSAEGVINEVVPSNKRSGKALFWFKTATLGEKECHSSADSERNILVPVEYHLVPSPSGGVLVLFLEKETHIECLFLKTLVLIMGSSTLLGWIAPVNHLGTKFTLEINAPEGKQECTEYPNDSGETVLTALKVKVDGGSEATMVQEDAGLAITTAKETEIVEGSSEAAECRSGVFIFPATYKFSALKATKEFLVVNKQLVGETVDSGAINPAGADFKVIGGKTCYEHKIYTALASCGVTIEAVAKGSEKFEVTPKVRTVAKANLKV